MISWVSIIGYVGIALPVDKTWTIHDLRNIINTTDIAAIIYSNFNKELIKQVRKEYKDIYNNANMTDLDKQDKICLTALIYPEDFDLECVDDLYETELEDYEMEFFGVTKDKEIDDLEI